MRFKVRKTSCPTCIYNKNSPLDLNDLEDQVRDNHGGFEGYRICHHSNDLCCRGFWNRHKDEFQLGQVAQRLDLVEYTNEA